MIGALAAAHKAVLEAERTPCWDQLVDKPGAVDNRNWEEMAVAESHFADHSPAPAAQNWAERHILRCPVGGVPVGLVAVKKCWRELLIRHSSSLSSQLVQMPCHQQN